MRTGRLTAIFLAAVAHAGTALSAACSQPQEAPPATRSVSGEAAFSLASQLVEDRRYDDAEAILKTIASAGPGPVDHLKIDRLAAKIAFQRGEHRRAIDLLTAVVAAAPNDWRARYDLAHVCMAAKRDRRAKRELATLMAMPLDGPVKEKIRRDLSMLEERRLMRFSVRAAAAPSTNINNGSNAPAVVTQGGFLRLLDDNARAQSGVGVSWAMGGEIAPPLTRRLRGHIGVRTNFTDHANADFDFATTRLEAGFRHRMPGPRPVQTKLVATYARQQFGGDGFAAGRGGTLEAVMRLSPRLTTGIGLTAEDWTFDVQPRRNGLLTQADLFANWRWSRTAASRLSVGVGRQEAASPVEAHDRLAISFGTRFAGPFGTRLGVTPTIIRREFDAASGFFGVAREDVTTDLSLSLGHRHVALRGFYPSVIYRYTDNQSTVDLFSHDRQGVDVAIARGF